MIATREKVPASERARNQIGLTLAQAAKLARIQPKYLRWIELHGTPSFALATSLAAIYKIRIDAFL